MSAFFGDQYERVPLGCIPLSKWVIYPQYPPVLYVCCSKPTLRQVSLKNWYVEVSRCVRLKFAMLINNHIFVCFFKCLINRYETSHNWNNHNVSGKAMFGRSTRSKIGQQTYHNCYHNIPTVTPKWRYFHFRHLMKILVVVWTYHRTDFYLFSLMFTYFNLFFIYFWRFRIDHRRMIFLSYILKNRFGHKKNFGIMSFFSSSGGLPCFFLYYFFPMAEFPRGVVKSSLILMLKDSIYLKVTNVTSFSIWICFKMRCPFLVPK